MGKSGAARVKSGGAGYAGAMQDHEDRLDLAGTRRRVRETPPLVYSPYAAMDAPNPFDETVKKREPDKFIRRKNIRAIIEEKPESIRLDQALFSSQFRSALMRALASSMSFRMSAVRATFGGFPALIMA